MDRSDSLDKLATALAAAQAEIKGAPKSSDNPFFKSKYADLAEVWDACRAQLTSHGLSVVQFPATTENGRVALRTVLLHASGEFLSDVFSLAPVKHDPQGVGSALTYMRRYALSAVAGVPQVDDDGNAATAPGEPAAVQSDEGPHYDAADTQERTMAGAKPVYVTKVREAASKPGAVKPWKAVFCTLSDGREAGIFTDHQNANLVIPMLRESHRTQRGVFLDLQPGRDGKTFAIATAVWSDEVVL